MKVWWCNQSRCWDAERRAGVVCASEQMENVTYRRTVEEVEEGDIIVHYRRGHVVALSRAMEGGQYYPELPLVDGRAYGSGWRFETDYFELVTPIHWTSFGPELVPYIVMDYPIDRRGRVRQGYFFPFDMDGLRVILSHSSQALPGWLATMLVSE